MTLRDIEQGGRGRITGIRARGQLSQKLSDMGFVKGADVQVIRSAPLRDPLQVKVVHTFIALRRDEAELVEIEPAQ